MLDKIVLEKKLPGVKVVTKELTVSTNNDAKEMINSSPSDTLITSEKQTGGRGRQGKSFSSPEGGLYMTLLLRCGMPITTAVGATSCSAVAVSRAIKNVCGIDTGIKWVNDIYAGGKKLCGILTEAVNDYSRGISEYLVIGIGINVLSTPVVPSSSVECTSLSELGYTASREELCAEIVRELISMRDKSFDFSLYSDEYAARSVVIGREITFTRNGETKHGVALGIDKHGGLIVCSDNETLLLDSGEISVRLRSL